MRPRSEVLEELARVQARAVALVAELASEEEAPPVVVDRERVRRTAEKIRRGRRTA